MPVLPNSINKEVLKVLDSVSLDSTLDPVLQHVPVRLNVIHTATFIYMLVWTYGLRSKNDQKLNILEIIGILATFLNQGL